MKEIVVFKKMADWIRPATPTELTGFIEWNGNTFAGHGDTHDLLEHLARNTKLRERAIEEGVAPLRLLLMGSTSLQFGTDYYSDPPEDSYLSAEDQYDYESVRQDLLANFGPSDEPAT